MVFDFKNFQLGNQFRDWWLQCIKKERWLTSIVAIPSFAVLKSQHLMVKTLCTVVEVPIFACLLLVKTLITTLKLPFLHSENPFFQYFFVGKQDSKKKWDGKIHQNPINFPQISSWPLGHIIWTLGSVFLRDWALMALMALSVTAESAQLTLMAGSQHVYAWCM